MHEELFFLWNFCFSWLLDGICTNFDLLGNWVNESSIHVDLNHLIRSTEFRIARHCHIEREVHSHFVCLNKGHRVLIRNFGIVCHHFTINYVGYETIENCVEGY